MFEEALTIATVFTLLRLFISPVVALMISNKSWVFAGILFLFAAITDFLDGFLARARNELTSFGKYLDPIADKVLLIFVFLAFALDKPAFSKMPHSFAIFVICREVLMMVGTAYICFYKKILDVKPTIWGKVTTFFYLLFIAFFIFDSIFALNVNLELPLWCLMLLSIGSFVHYFKIALFKMRSKKSDI